MLSVMFKNLQFVVVDHQCTGCSRLTVRWMVIPEGVREGPRIIMCSTCCVYSVIFADGDLNG